MQQVYSECTCCFRPLNPSEIQLNQDKENYYYSICEECLSKYCNRLIEIAND